MQIKIELTKAQVELLEPLFTEIIIQEKSNNYCSIFAQIYDTEEGGAFIKALTLDGETSRKIQAATGVESGETSTPGKKHSVWVVE